MFCDLCGQYKIHAVRVNERVVCHECASNLAKALPTDPESELLAGWLVEQFEENRMPTVTWDPESTRFLDANAAALTLLGYSKQQLVELRVVDIVETDELGQKAILMNGQPIVKAELLEVNGSRGCFRTSVIGALTAYGGRVCRIAILYSNGENESLSKQSRSRPGSEYSAPKILSSGKVGRGTSEL